MKFDFAVIGAGISGAAASLLLSDAGFRVALIEKEGRTAPLVRGFRRNGVQFDTGFHYAGGLGEGEVLDLLLRRLGVARHLERERLDPEFDTVLCRRPDFTFRFPQGIDPLRSALHKAFPREREGIDAYLREIERACEAFPYMNLEADPPRSGLAEGSTLQEVLDRLFGDPLLKGILGTHSLLYGVRPQEASFALHALVAGPYYRSAHALMGGGRSLAEAFDAELARRGVEVLCGTEAKTLLLGEDGRVKGIRLAGGAALDCGGCVATVHPRVLLDLVPEGVFRPAYRKRLSALEETACAFLLFGAADHPAVRKLAGGNLFLLEEPGTPGALESEDPQSAPIYLTSARAAEKAESDGFLAIIPASPRTIEKWRDSAHGNRPSAYRDFKEAMVRNVQDRLDTFCPGLKAAIRWSEGATPLTLRHYGGSAAGGLYGVKHRVGQFNPQPLTRVPNLWLAGQATAAPGVLGAAISAYLACGEILGHERLRRELRECR